MQRATTHTTIFLMLATLGLTLGCSGSTQAAKPQASVEVASPQAADVTDAPGGPMAASDVAEGSESSLRERETTPMPPVQGGVASTDDGEWAHADTPANPPESVTPEEGRAPDFRVTTLEGELIDSSILYGSKPVSITIWATWCPPCLAEIPTIQKLYNEHGDKVQFIAISVDDPKQLKEVEKMVAARKMTYPVGLDVEREIGQAFQADGIPLTVFVDPSGAEIGREEGWGGEENLIHAFEEAFFKDGEVPTKRKGSSV